MRCEAISSALHRFSGTIPSFGKILGFVLQRSYDDVASDRKVYGFEGERIPLAPPKHREISKERVSLTSRGHDIMDLTPCWWIPEYLSERSLPSALDFDSPMEYEQLHKRTTQNPRDQVATVRG